MREQCSTSSPLEADLPEILDQIFKTKQGHVDPWSAIGMEGAKAIGDLIGKKPKLVLFVATEHARIFKF